MYFGLALNSSSLLPCNKTNQTEWVIRASHAVPTLCQGPSFYLKFLVKKRHNSRNKAFKVMPLVLQLHLVMMRKYTKFGVDTFNTFWVMCYIKFLHDDDNRLLLNRQAKNGKYCRKDMWITSYILVKIQRENKRGISSCLGGAWNFLYRILQNNWYRGNMRQE